MSNVHRGNGESFQCPDKGNRFPMRIHDEAAGRFVDVSACPGCGADLQTYYAREEAPPTVEGQPSEELVPEKIQPRSRSTRNR